MKPVRFFNALLFAALTLVVWAAFQVFAEDCRRADPRNSMDYWKNMTVFGETPEVPESRDGVAAAKRWIAANADWLQWVIVGVGMFASIHEFRSGLGLKPGQWIWEAGRTRSGWELDAPLLQWSKSDAWTLRDSFAGTFITGANGSGKTSGSGRAVALAFLRRAKFGGLVLTAKSEETDLWRSYCREAGREQDLVVFGADGGLRFDPIDFELNRPGVGAGHTENIVQLLSTLLELTERNTGGGGGREDEGYWRKASRQKTRNIVDLLALSKGTLSIPDMYQVVISAPSSPAEARSAEWRKNSFCFQCLAEADRKPLTPSRKRDLQIVADYWLGEFPGLSEKTRSVIVSTFTSMIDVLNRGLLRELFCSGTNVTPLVIEEGKIVVVNLPVLEYGEVGLYGQVIWKHAFQRSIERRDVRTSPRPVFLWADEAQYFVTSHDMGFATTCRSFRSAIVYLTQNVNNLYAALGGEQKGKAEAESLMACLNTRIFHANSCPITNEICSGFAGRSRQFFVNANTSNDGDWVSGLMGMSGGAHTSAGISESYELEIQPSELSTLRTGGPENGFNVDAIVFQNGKLFADTGRTWRYATFNQRS